MIFFRIVGICLTIIELRSDFQYNACMHVVIFTGGALQHGLAVTKSLSQFDKVIAADSGAASAVSLKITPDVVIGDFDSIDENTVVFLKKRNTEFIRFPKEKDATDTELAIDFAVKNGATKITVLGGAAGDRIDHVLANVFLPMQYSVPIFFVDADSVLWFANGPKKEIIKGRSGDLLSLIPLSQIEEIKTASLQYPLHNETLFVGRSRGVSNMFTQKEAEIKWKSGQLFIIHTLAKA